MTKESFNSLAGILWRSAALLGLISLIIFETRFVETVENLNSFWTGTI